MLMSKKEQAQKVIQSHVLWSLVAGALPVPFLDIAGVTFIQMDMFKQISKIYKADFDLNKGKALITSFVASTMAGILTIGPSLFKTIKKPASIVSNAVFQAAITYALGYLFLNAYDEGKCFFDLGLANSTELFEEAFEKGKEYVKALSKN